MDGNSDQDMVTLIYALCWIGVPYAMQDVSCLQRSTEHFHHCGRHEIDLRWLIGFGNNR